MVNSILGNPARLKKNAEDWSIDVSFVAGNIMGVSVNGQAVDAMQYEVNKRMTDAQMVKDDPDTGTRTFRMKMSKLTDIVKINLTYTISGGTQSNDAYIVIDDPDAITVYHEEEENPSASPSDNPGEDPSAPPGDDPGENPSAQPSDDPGEDPSAQPGDDPGEDPSAQPSDNPGENPSASPGVSPVAAPTTSPAATTQNNTAGTTAGASTNKQETKTGTGKKTTKKTVGNVIYKVSGSAATVAGVSQKKAATVTKLTVRASVKIGSKTYPVTGINKKAFAKCKKLKKLVIKTKKLKKSTVAGKAFQGMSSKLKIYVPKTKLAAYRKIFLAKGLNKKAKIVKEGKK